MRVNKIVQIIGTIASIAGIVCFFVPSVPPQFTFICAALVLLDSIVQVFWGDQNSFATEIVAAVIALIVSLVFHLNPFTIIAVALCIESAIMWISGLILLAIVGR